MSEDDITRSNDNVDDIPNQPEFVSNDLPVDIAKIEMDFWFFGILIFWIFSGFFLSLIINVPGGWILFALIGLYIDSSESKLSNTIRSFLFFFIKLFFGLRLEGEFEPKHRIIRFWWFFTFGFLISGFIVLLLANTLAFIIPLILIFWKYKKVLRFLFIASFLPKSEFVWMKSEADRRYDVEKFSHIPPEDREYLAFNKPTKLTHFVGILLILSSPVIISFQILPITYAVSQDFEITQEIFNQALFYIPFGIMAIIPYLILGLPLFKGKRLTTLVNTYIASNITKSLATTGLNTIPYFKGEYFLETESDLIDMKSSLGFFEIFRKGRFFSIIITPLAIVSLLLRYTILRIDEATLKDTKISPLDFIDQFNTFMRNDPIVWLFVLVVIPIAITIVLTLIWSINDAEIKRASWKSLGEGTHIEIRSVEDLGKSLDNIFKLVIGVSAITNLASAISIIVTSNEVIGWSLAMLILTLIAMVVLPGTIAMAYIYFASGDHVKGVNYLRYFLSRENKIAVGTISRDYLDEVILGVPSDRIYINLPKRRETTIP